jgi:hypothetical protein
MHGFDSHSTLIQPRLQATPKRSHSDRPTTSNCGFLAGEDQFVNLLRIVSRLVLVVNQLRFVIAGREQLRNDGPAPQFVLFPVDSADVGWSIHGVAK